MDANTRAMVSATLAEYGANLTEDDFIQRGDKPSQIKVLAMRGRLRFESGSGQRMAIGPIAAQAVRSFVESFWYWKKA